MNGFVERLKQRWQGFWGGLPPRTRLWFIAGTAFLVFALLLLTATLGAHRGPAMVPLFTQLDAQDAGAIVAKLKEQKVPYGLASGGSTILVPQAQVYDLRLSMASQGLPSQGVVGFEILDKTPLGATDFERRMRYNWALEGELTRTIRQLAQVEDARVHLVVPEPSVFLQDKQVPTASVLLKLRPYTELKASEVAGIAHLVASSVPGLRPEDVTVVDQYGNVLSDKLHQDAGSNDGSPTVAQRFALQQAQDDRLSQSLQSMLEQVFGPGRVVARVHADYDFDAQTSSAELYQPAQPGGNTGIIRSEQQTNETYSGTTQPGGGVPGVASNVPGYVAAPTGQPTNSTYSKSDVIRNYEISKQQIQTVSAPGKIKRLSVSVFVNARLGQAEMAQIQNAVAAAVGYDSQRGDQLSVVSLPFGPPQPARRPVASAKAKVPGWWPWAIAAVVLVVGVVGIVLQRRRQAARRAAEELAAQQAQARVEAATEAEVPKPSTAEAGAPGPSPQEVALDAAEKEKQRVLREIERLARQRPERFAQLLRVWLTQEEK